MIRSSLSLPVVAALVFAVSAAEAKVPTDGIELCGQGGCVRLSAQHAMAVLGSGGHPGAPLREPASFFVLRWKWATEGEEYRGYYVPASRALRWPSGSGAKPAWARVGDEAAFIIERAATGLSPYPAALPSAVTVGTREARGPETYFRLLRGRPAGFTPVTPWVTVHMHSDPAGPWTDGASEIRISARGRSRFVYIDGWVHRVPLWIANRARRGLPLAR